MPSQDISTLIGTSGRLLSHAHPIRLSSLINSKLPSYDPNPMLLCVPAAPPALDGFVISPSPGPSDTCGFLQPLMRTPIMINDQENRPHPFMTISFQYLIFHRCTFFPIRLRRNSMTFRHR